MSTIFSNPNLSQVLVTNAKLNGHIGITRNVVLTLAESYTYAGAKAIAELKAAYDAPNSPLPAQVAAGDIVFTEVVETNNVAGPDTISANVKQKTITVGAVGVAGCDFNYTTAANKTAQNLDLGAVIPAQSVLLMARAKCTVVPEGTHTMLQYSTVALTQAVDLVANKEIAFNLKVTAIATDTTVTTAIKVPFNSTQATTATDLKTAVEAVANIASLTISGSNKVYTIVADEGYTVAVDDVTVTGKYTTITKAYSVPIKGMSNIVLTQSANTTSGKTIAFNLNVTNTTTGVTTTTAISQAYDTSQTVTAQAIETAVEAVTGIASLTLSGSDLIYTIVASAGYTISVSAITVTADAFTFTNVATVPANAIAFVLGTSSAGNELGASTTLDDVGDFTALGAGTAPLIALSNSAQNVWLGATPTTSNWALLTKGKWDVTILYVELDN